jgi:flagellin FlaB
MLNRINNFRRDEEGQAALETAIILIAFIVVASVFAFTILSAGTASTDRGEEAIYEGLEGVQSTMAIRGAMIANSSAGTSVDSIVFNLALASGGDPVDLTDDGTGPVVIAYRDSEQVVNALDYTVDFIVDDGDADAVLEDGELAEVTVDLSTLTTALDANVEFTIEVNPPTGAVLNLSRTTPAAIETVMELR